MGELDLNSIVSSVDSRIGENTEVETEGAKVDSSESTVASPEDTSSSTTSVGEAEVEDGSAGNNSGEGNVGSQKESGVTETGVSKATSETGLPKQRKSYNRSNSELARAQYSASKWQKKYKNLKADFDRNLAEFAKYKDLDAGKFENDEDRQQYLAWKASKQQRLQDLSEDMNGARNAYAEQLEDIRSQMQQQEREIYNEKVDDIYGENADAFHELDSQWGDVYEVACRKFDTGNVIRDFIDRSGVGPAIKNVIYSNPQLQSDLFEKGTGNAMIDASERLRILKGVEKSIYKFLNNPTPAQNVEVPAKKKALPHLPPRPNQSTAPAAKPQVTGSLTRGGSTSGDKDIHSEVASLYHSVFG